MGHIVSLEGVKVEPKKNKAITKWPIHRDIKGLRGFFSPKGYYRKFAENYEHIVGPLTSLFKKKSFEDATLLFSFLKDVMTPTPMLETLDFGKTSIVECDALGQGIGAMFI